MASPPVNIMRSDDRSCSSSAGEFNIMMNCVDTQHSTDTFSRSTSRIMPSALKWLMTAQGAPMSVGVKCAVHSPKPNGAGTTDIQLSSAVSPP